MLAPIMNLLTFSFVALLFCDEHQTEKVKSDSVKKTIERLPSDIEVITCSLGPPPSFEGKFIRARDVWWINGVAPVWRLFEPKQFFDSKQFEDFAKHINHCVFASKDHTFSVEKSFLGQMNWQQGGIVVFSSDSQKLVSTAFAKLEEKCKKSKIGGIEVYSQKFGKGDKNEMFIAQFKPGYIVWSSYKEFVEHVILHPTGGKSILKKHQTIWNEVPFTSKFWSVRFFLPPAEQSDPTSPTNLRKPYMNLVPLDKHAIAEIISLQLENGNLKTIETQYFSSNESIKELVMKRWAFCKEFLKSDSVEKKDTKSLVLKMVFDSEKMKSFKEEYGDDAEHIIGLMLLALIGQAVFV